MGSRIPAVIYYIWLFISTTFLFSVSQEIYTLFFKPFINKKYLFYKRYFLFSNCSFFILSCTCLMMDSLFYYYQGYWWKGFKYTVLPFILSFFCDGYTSLVTAVFFSWLYFSLLCNWFSLIRQMVIFYLRIEEWKFHLRLGCRRTWTNVTPATTITTSQINPTHLSLKTLKSYRFKGIPKNQTPEDDFILEGRG